MVLNPEFIKYLRIGDNHLEEKLEKDKLIILAVVFIIILVIKFLLIPHSMMTMGDSATRAWNAWWWANDPFFVVPQSGHPFWFYMMGTIMMITGEIYYTSIITMIIIMTLSSYFIFRISYLFFSFRTSVLALLIFSFNPVIFRLNFEPYSLQPSHLFIVLMVYFLLKAKTGYETERNFTIAGLMGFLALGFRPEALFIILAFAFMIAFSNKKGKWNFIIFSLLFQLIWIVVSYVIYGEPFRTLNAADEYTGPVNIEELSIALRLKGLMLPLYFLAMGLTIFIFYFFIKGLIYIWKNYPKAVSIILLIPVIVPALINGVMSVKSTIYHTTHYIYLMFYFTPVIAAAGLNEFSINLKNRFISYTIVVLIILSAIPLSYIKEFVPESYSNYFPKVIQFLASTREPDETRMLIDFIDNNINNYPSLIFDSEDNESSIFYVPFRSKLAPPDNVLISRYNVSSESESLKDELLKFMNRNERGIAMHRKGLTSLSSVFMEYFIQNFPGLQKKMETENWVVYTWE